MGGEAIAAAPLLSKLVQTSLQTCPNVSPNFTSAAARMQGKSESEPMITPTSGRAVSEAAPPSTCPAAAAPSRILSAAAAAAAEGAVTLTCPILRRGLGGSLPYQWTEAHGRESARRTGASVEGSSPEMNVRRCEKV